MPYSWASLRSVLGFPVSAADAITLAIRLFVTSKSAQILLCLAPGRLGQPNTRSPLIHAATMVTVGVY